MLKFLFNDIGRPTFHAVRHDGNSKKVEKTTRVRTVLNEKQLHTLRTCYAANPRPDAMMKEQLVEMTGLSPRVIRVWFQNKRCKDKKKSIQMKQQQGTRSVSSPEDQVGIRNNIFCIFQTTALLAVRSYRLRQGLWTSYSFGTFTTHGYT